MIDHEEFRAATENQSVSQSKRTLLKAGWVAPVVVALSLPVASFDANASPGGRRREPRVREPRVREPRVRVPRGT
jgi:hypothetical protein